MTEFGTFVLVIYIIFIAVYQVIALGVYNWRYSRAAASIKGYHSVMKKVEKLQEREERSLPLED